MSELTEQNLTRQQAEQEMACLRRIYASVRLLDPKTLAEEPCYPPWKNVHPCTSCVGREAMAGRCQCSKLETLRLLLPLLQLLPLLLLPQLLPALRTSASVSISLLITS